MNQQQISTVQQMFASGLNKQTFSQQPQIFRYCCNCSSEFDESCQPALLTCGHVCCRECSLEDEQCDICGGKIQTKVSPFKQLLSYWEKHSKTINEYQDILKFISGKNTESSELIERASYFKDKMVQFLEGVDLKSAARSQNIENKDFTQLSERALRLIGTEKEKKQKLSKRCSIIGERFQKRKNLEQIMLIEDLIIQMEKQKGKKAGISRQLQLQQIQLARQKDRIVQLEYHLLGINQMIKQLKPQDIASFHQNKFNQFQSFINAIEEGDTNKKYIQQINSKGSVIEVEVQEEKQSNPLSSNNESLKYNNRILQMQKTIQKLEEVIASIAPVLT